MNLADLLHRELLIVVSRKDSLFLSGQRSAALGHVPFEVLGLRDRAWIGGIIHEQHIRAVMVFPLGASSSGLSKRKPEPPHTG